MLDELLGDLYLFMVDMTLLVLHLTNMIIFATKILYHSK